VGAGGAYEKARFAFPYGSPYGTIVTDTFLFNFNAGLNLLDRISISYTLRTDFYVALHKVAVGFIYRFQ
jgi:hypothetical protein